MDIALSKSLLIVTESSKSYGFCSSSYEEVYYFPSAVFLVDVIGSIIRIKQMLSNEMR